MSLVERLNAVYAAEDPWLAFVELMPNEHRDKVFCKTVLTSYTVFGVLSTLLQKRVVTRDVYFEYCGTLTEKEVLRYMTRYKNTKSKTKAVYCLFEYAYLNDYKVKLHDSKYWTKLAIKYKDKKLINKYTCIVSATKYMMRYPELIHWVLNELGLYNNTTDIYRRCYMDSLYEVIKFILAREKITVKDFFLRRYALCLPSREQDQAIISAFHKAGLTYNELVEINSVEDVSITIWLDSHKEDV